MRGIFFCVLVRETVFYNILIVIIVIKRFAFLSMHN